MKEIPLTQGRVAIVDDEDYDRLNAYKWYYHDGYAKRGVFATRSVINMSQYVLTVLDDRVVDHIDGNGLNNLRSNLRLATTTQNKQNQSKHRMATSRYKGVRWSCEKGKWAVGVTYMKRSIFLGYYKNEIAAACAYDIAATLLFGEFAKVNFQ